MKKIFAEDSIEAIILNNISQVSAKAIALARQKQLAYVVLEGSEIVRIFPDGSREVLQIFQKQNRIKSGKTLRIF